MSRGGAWQIRDVELIWKTEVVVDGRIETVRSVKFADGKVIQDRERFPYFDFNTNDSTPGVLLGYRIWWYGCQRCEAWRQVIRDILIEKGDMTAFKFAMQVLILYEDRWMDFFVCEDCMKLRRKGIRRDPLSKMFIDWGPEGAYPPPIHSGWRRTAADMNRFGEAGLASI
ncbi:MAG: hypothetical protein ACQETG_11645 [Thermodesulfobacteriota bacterium]